MPGKEKADSKTKAPAAALAAPSSSNADAAAPAPASDAPTKSHHGKRVPKPDKVAHEKNLDALKSKIDALQAQFNEVQKSISGSGNVKETYGGKRSELKAKLDELAKKRNEINDTRGKLLDKIKSTQAGIRKALDDARTSKDKLGVKSVGEIDERIRELESQLNAGGLKLIDEKKTVTEISNLKKSRKTLETLGSHTSSVESDKQLLDTLRAELNALDPQKKEVNDEYDVVKAELRSLDDDKKKDLGSLNELFDRRTKVKTELDALYTELKTARADFKKANDLWYESERADRERRQREAAEARKAEAAVRLERAAERQLQEALIPAFTAEIDACNALLVFLQPYAPGVKTTATAAAKSKLLAPSPFAAPAASPRKVEPLPTGGRVLNKKDNRGDDYMVLGKSKKSEDKGKKSKPAAAVAAAPATDGAAVAPSTPAASSRPFKLDLQTMDMFYKLKLSPPTAASEAEAAIAAVEEKKAKFLADQEEATARNKAKAEARIAAIKAKALAGGSVEEAVAELGGDAAEEKDPETL